jgi:predicted ArsR family transcriptional regulator
MAEDISKEHKPELVNLNFEQRLDLIKEVMADEGYEIQWKKKDDVYEIQEIACPFYQIGKEHPEICLFDQTLISSILEVTENDIIRTKHRDNHCSFRIKR